MKMSGGILSGEEVIGGRRNLLSDTQVLAVRFFFLCDLCQFTPLHNFQFNALWLVYFHLLAFFFVVISLIIFWPLEENS